MVNLKLKKNHKLIIAADGSAASGKTTGARIISKKYGLKFYRQVYYTGLQATRYLSTIQKIGKLF